MDWRSTYPTVADVALAGVTTLEAWDKHLPAAQTDVERAVRRRISKRLDELAGLELRQKRPDLADKLNHLTDLAERMTGGKFRRF